MVVSCGAGRRHSRRDRSVRVVGVRLTEFRGLMQAQFGPLRAPSVARDHVFSALAGRTADEALAAGEVTAAIDGVRQVDNQLKSAAAAASRYRREG